MSVRSTLRRLILVTGLAVFAAVFWRVFSRDSKAPLPYRDVVLITIDTLRADHLGSYGYPLPTSPFLDSLASRGVLFENTIAPMSHTAPSHATIFTSLYPESHGVHVNGAALPEGIETLPSVLGRHGYETAAFASVRFLELVAPGFDHFQARRLGATTVIDWAIDWLSGRRTGTPAFIWIHLYDVHQYAANPPIPGFVERIRTARDENPEAFSAYLQRVRDRKGLGDSRQRKFANYDSRIAYVDAEIRRLHDWIEEREAPGEETLWVITSDHGEGLGNHGLMGHGKHLYTEQLRVPLIISPAPEATAGHRVPHLTRLLDLRPTIMDLLGLDDAGGERRSQGVSLGPYLHRRGARVEIDHAFAQRRPVDEKRRGQGWPEGLVLAARTLDSKYIFNQEGEDEYYDLREDPGETNNLIDQDLPEIERLRRWLLTTYRDLHAGRPDQDSEIRPEFVEELRALGYIE